VAEEDLSVYPRERLFTNEGALARRAAIYVDGRNVRWLADADLTECLLSGTAKTRLLFPILAASFSYSRELGPIHPIALAYCTSGCESRPVPRFPSLR
jgi:hypothetical protein